MQDNNKRITINTIIVYVKIIVVALVSFFTTRYVLEALGVSDYGLYNVVGGIVTMLNFISIAMVTTTRRYVNVEMGRPNGNVNKIFNVCLVLHIGFALFIYFVAITIGLWYIDHFLNVSPEKYADARFVFFVSTTVSALSIINVPYQALMIAFERFKSMAIIDILLAFLKVPLVVLLLLYEGNHLRFYAVGFCIITLIGLICYHLYCYLNFKEVVRWNFCTNYSLYKEIILFNNYTALGAFAFLGRSQGSTMVVNYFFGTIVNGAYAIALQIESQIQNLVVNLGTAADPQMTQSYSAGNFSRSYSIVAKVTRFSILSVILLTFPIFVELEFLLGLWLTKIPDGAVLFCQVMLFSLFVRSFGAGVDGLIQATGRVKWYQIIQSFLLIMGIPLAILFFSHGFHAIYIIVAFIISDFLRTIFMFIVVCHVSSFRFIDYAKSVYIPISKIVPFVIIYYYLYQLFPINNSILHFMGLFFTLFISLTICFLLGLSSGEKAQVVGGVISKLKLR